jgi:hypothetical protein
MTALLHHCWCMLIFLELAVVLLHAANGSAA